jgi:NADPH:quinone reductase-like Zn-dependent oxidoreductase
MCSLKDPAASFPSVPGYEGVGTVVGGDLDGKRVAFGAPKGSFAEYIYTALVIPVPESLPSEQAACAVVNPLTAIGMVERAIELKAESVIITAAGGALGKMFITILLKNKIKPICTVRKSEVAEALKKEFNIDTVFCSEDENYNKSLEESCTANNASVCFECIGDDSCG